MSFRPAAMAILAATAVLGACTPGDPYAGQVRGRGLTVVDMPSRAQASAYAAALGGAFDLGPGLSLLADPQYLPRGEGWVGGDPMPTEVVSALRSRAVVRGTCQPPRGQRAVPVCAAAAPGYVVRFSPIFRVGGDTVEVYVGVVKYRTAPNQPSDALRFERAYQVVGSGERWRVIREARIPAPGA